MPPENQGKNRVTSKQKIVAVGLVLTVGVIIYMVVGLIKGEGTSVPVITVTPAKTTGTAASTPVSAP